MSAEGNAHIVAKNGSGSDRRTPGRDPDNQKREDASDEDAESPRNIARREAFLKAAYAEFVEKGYERTKLTSVVKRAGGGSLATATAGSARDASAEIQAMWRDSLKLANPPVSIAVALPGAGRPGQRRRRPW